MKLNKRQIMSLAATYCKHGQTLLSHPQCSKLLKNPEHETIGFFDIEASDLKASIGIMLSYCFKDNDTGKVYGRVITPEEIRSPEKDKWLVQECVEDMLRFHRIMHYYGKRYDVPFVRSRAMKHNLYFPPLGTIVQTDVYDIVRHKLKLHRSSMETACKFLGIISKTHGHNFEVWLQAITGDEKALDFIWKHNQEDVASLKKLWERLEFATRKTECSI